MVKPHGNMRGGVIYALNEQNQYQPVTIDDIIRFITYSVTDIVSNYSLRSCVFKSTLKDSIKTSNLYDYSNKEIRGLAFKLVFHSTERAEFEIAGTNKVSELNETNKLEYGNQTKIDDLFTNINIVPQVAMYIDDTTTVNNFLDKILKNPSTSIDVEFFDVISDIIEINQTQQPVIPQRQYGINQLFGKFLPTEMRTTPVELSMMIMEYIPEKYEDLYNFRYEAIKNNKLPLYESICQFIVACLIIIRERLDIINIDLHAGNILIDSELIKQTVPIPPHELFEKIKIIDWGAVKKVTPITPGSTNTYIFNTIQLMVDENMYDGKYSQMKWLCSLLYKIIPTQLFPTLTTGNETTILLSDYPIMEAELQTLHTQLESIKVDWSDGYEKSEKYNKYKDITQKMNEISDKLAIFESKSVTGVTIKLEDKAYDTNNDIKKLRNFCNQVRVYKDAIEKQIPPSKKTKQINEVIDSQKKVRRI